jgi:hypothetical protein
MAEQTHHQDSHIPVSGSVLGVDLGFSKDERA